MPQQAKLDTLMNLTDADCTHCIADPDQDHIIDMIHPNTGKTVINGKTLEECRQEEPNAQILHIDEYCRIKAQRQDTPITWEEITEDRYYDLMECLPPALYGQHYFLVGEPWDHHAVSGHPRYQACRVHRGQYYASTRPLQKSEFHQALMKEPTS